MSRKEFAKATKRLALKRSDQMCEAEGPLYGWEEGVLCLSPLSYGVEFDHFLAASNGGDASLDNCLAVCRKCHAFKTRNFDTPRAAKTVRQRDNHNGVKTKRPGNPMPGSKASGWKKLMSGEVVRR